jgi:tRNA threonylcarbamoyladenosine biosynthesis protein TsaE
LTQPVGAAPLRGDVYLADEASTREWAARCLAPLLAQARTKPDGVLVTLDGPLGAGKSALVRGVLRAAGVAGPVPSPTYTLVEPYERSCARFLHLDLYRLGDPDELALTGIDTLRERGTVVLAEWAGRMPGVLGKTDVALRIDYEGTGRRLHWCWEGATDGLVIQSLFI